MRYAGQGNEFTVWMSEDWTNESEAAKETAVTTGFEESYKRIYGMTIPGLPIELVTWRLRAWADPDAVEPPPLARTSDLAPEPYRERPVTFARGSKPVSTPVFRRSDLQPGDTLASPTIVEERETTVVLRPGWQASVADDGSIVADSP